MHDARAVMQKQVLQLHVQPHVSLENVPASLGRVKAGRVVGMGLAYDILKLYMHAVLMATNRVLPELGGRWAMLVGGPAGR